MMIRFQTIFFREVTAAVAITTLYGICGWDMGEPLAVFSMFAAGFFLQEWVIDKWEVRRGAKAHKQAGRKSSEHRAA